jgi:siroheme synthase
MGAGQARAIADALVAAGKSPMLPVAVLENASLPSARVFYTTLGSLPEIINVGMTGPAIIFVGPQYRVHAKTAVATPRHAAYELQARSAQA